MTHKSQTTRDDSQGDPHLERLLDQALASDAVPPDLADRIMANTRRQLADHSGWANSPQSAGTGTSVIARIGPLFRPLGATAAIAAILAIVAIISLNFTGKTPNGGGFKAPPVQVPTAQQIEREIELLAMDLALLESGEAWTQPVSDLDLSIDELELMLAEGNGGDRF